MRASSMHDMLPVDVCGMPAFAEVTHYHREPGSKSHNAPSDLDYHGYIEIEFRMYDRKGYRAEWLDKKIGDTHGEQERIENELIQAIANQRE